MWTNLHEIRVENEMTLHETMHGVLRVRNTLRVRMPSFCHYQSLSSGGRSPSIQPRTCGPRRGHTVFQSIAAVSLQTQAAPQNCDGAQQC